MTDFKPEIRDSRDGKTVVREVEVVGYFRVDDELGYMGLYVAPYGFEDEEAKIPVVLKVSDPQYTERQAQQFNRLHWCSLCPEINPSKMYRIKARIEVEEV